MSEGTGTIAREIVVYKASDGGPQVEVVVEGESVWLTSRQMSDLFQTTTRNIELHTQNAFAEGELDEEATAKESFVVRSEGGRQVRRRNKRTASLLFVDYLRRNDALLGTNGQPRFSNSACARRSSSSRRRSDCSGETSIS